jgi:hypothetical protein
MKLQPPVIALIILHHAHLDQAREPAAPEEAHLKSGVLPGLAASELSVWTAREAF